MTKSASEIIEQMRHERRLRIGLPEPPAGERQQQSPSEIIEQMRRDRRIRTGRDPLPRRDDVIPQIPLVALDPRLEALFTDRRFTALFSDATELRCLLEEIDTLLARCSLHHRSTLWRKALRHRRAARKRRSAEAPGRKAGRPAGAINISAQQYGLELAMLWFQYTGQPPSRYESKKQCGYFRFVELVLEAAPPRLRRSPAGRPPAIDYLVRISVMSFHVARRSENEYRRRGLLDEAEWLDRP
jgi:hypothetical protein